MSDERGLTHIGLDLGQRRIGIAVSVPLGLGARPHSTIIRDNDHQAAETLACVLDETNAEVCIAGLPLNMNGSEGKQAQRARSFIGRLRKLRPDVRYEMWDERLSSFAADELMESHDVAHSQRKARRDEYAATVILEEYLRRGAESS